MPKNYLIGIGGTGARVIESLVHCCAAGLGPQDLTIFLIDPDEGNGNLSRTTTLLREYQACRDALSGKSDAASRLFRTQIDIPDPFVWNIFADQNMTLGKYVNHELTRKNDPGFSDFMELLFSEAELTTKLNEGFRGHPSIGAVVMANAPDDVDPWKRFWTDVDNASLEHEIRVFLVGSLFGGTGAAGVPTFGAREMLKWRDRATLERGADRSTADGGHRGDHRGDSAKSKIFLGASLVLPYFSVDLSKRSASDTEMAVTPADYPAATKAALQYYDEKDLVGELAFDQVYLIGDSSPQQVGDFSPGKKTQDNRAHYVELSTALAAFDFFKLDPVSSGVRTGPRFFVASREELTVDWQSLPTTRDQASSQRLQGDVKRSLAAMTIFAYAFNTLGRETLDVEPDRIHDPWYCDHFPTKAKRGQDARDPRKGKESVEAVEKYCLKFLEWITSLDDKDNRVRLVDRANVFAALNGEAPALLNRTQHPGAIGGLLKGHPSRQQQFPAFINKLNELQLRDPNMPAVSKYVSLFYEAALSFAGDNWRLT